MTFASLANYEYAVKYYFEAISVAKIPKQNYFLVTAIVYIVLHIHKTVSCTGLR